MVLGSGIRDPGSGKNLFRFRIPDPGVKKAPDRGSRIRIRNTGPEILTWILEGWVSMALRYLHGYLKAESLWHWDTYVDTWRLSLYGPGRAAQRLSCDRCGTHSFSCLLIFLHLRCFPSLCHGEFCSQFWNTTFFACFRLAGIFFPLSITLCEKNCLLISSMRGSAALRVCLPDSVTGVNHVSLFTCSPYPFQSLFYKSAPCLPDFSSLPALYCPAPWACPRQVSPNASCGDVEVVLALILGYSISLEVWHQCCLLIQIQAFFS